MRIIFMGTPEFAAVSLDALHHSSHEVLAVVTVADKPSGRGQQLNESAVKKYALEKNIPVLQPIKLRDEIFLAELKSFKAELFVVVAFRMLPEEVWAMPAKGTINLHGSLLPQYRGAAPINWAIINGEKETGVTTFFIEKEIDTGKVILQTTIPIGENETAGGLHDRMMHIGAKTLVQTVDMIAHGKPEALAQDDFSQNIEELKPAPKIFKEDSEINWNKTVAEIHNFIRGLSPYPAARISLRGKTLKIFSGEKKFEPSSSSPGEFQTDGKTFLSFQCNDAQYSITDLQLEGKRRMNIEEFLRGWRDSSE